MWLNYRGDPGRSAFLNTILRPPLRIRWQAQQGNCIGIHTNGQTVAIMESSRIIGLDIKTGSLVWEFGGRKKKEFDMAFWTSTAEAIFINSCGRLRSLGWDGTLRWERRAPKGMEDAASNCFAHGTWWAAHYSVFDTKNGEMLHSFGSFDAGAFRPLAYGRGLLWCEKWPPESSHARKIVGLDPLSYGEIMKITFHAERAGTLIVTDNYIVRSITDADRQDKLAVWSAVDGRLLHKFPINIYGPCISGDRLWCFVRPDSNKNDQKLVCYDLKDGRQICTHETTVVFRCLPIATQGHVWFTHVESGKKCFLVAVDGQTGKTVWQTKSPGIDGVIAAQDCLLIRAGKKIHCLEPEDASGAPVSSPSRAKETARTPQPSLGRIASLRGCVKLNRNGRYPLGKVGALLLDPAKKPKTIALAPTAGPSAPLVEGLDGSNHYMSAFDAIEVEETAVIGLKVPDGARLILLRKGSQQTIDIHELTCIEVLLNAQGTHVVCALVTTDGEVGDATLRVYEMDTGKIAHEVALEPESLLAMNLRWVDDSHIAFRNEEAGDEEEWYVWDLGNGEVEAVG